jgi:iron complex outermembrane recepter protein
VNTFYFGGVASFCGITPSCVASSGEANTVQGTPFPNARTDPNLFVPVVDANGTLVTVGAVPQCRYVIVGAGTLAPEFQTYYNSGYILTDLNPDYG